MVLCFCLVCLNFFGYVGYDWVYQSRLKNIRYVRVNAFMLGLVIYAVQHAGHTDSSFMDAFVKQYIFLFPKVVIMEI